MLINYWYRRVEANKSAMKALLMNRVGDWGLTIGILYIYSVYQNVDYSIISGMGGVMRSSEYITGVQVMTLYILIGAIAKSAQIGQKEAYRNEINRRLKAKIRDNKYGKEITKESYELARKEDISFQISRNAGTSSYSFRSAGLIRTLELVGRFENSEKNRKNPVDFNEFSALQGLAQQSCKQLGLNEPLSKGGVFRIMARRSSGVTTLNKLCLFTGYYARVVYFQRKPFLTCTRYARIGNCRLDSGKFERQGENQQGVGKEFKEWLIGFTEGDGSFTMTNGKPIYSIHLNKMDLPLLYEIQAELGMGNVYINKDSAIFIVKAKGDILKLIEIFNGRIYMGKVRKRFKEWVMTYTRKYGIEVELKSLEWEPSIEDGWLAGLIDAEGCFTVTVSKRKIIQRFILGQKGANEELRVIAKLLGGKMDGNEDSMMRVVVSYRDAGGVLEYLERFELRSVKKIALRRWKEIYEIREKVLNKQSLNTGYYAREREEKIKEIKKKAKMVNNLRKVEELRL